MKNRPRLQRSICNVHLFLRVVLRAFDYGVIYFPPIFGVKMYGWEPTTMAIINISTYKFVTLSAGSLPDLRVVLKDEADACSLKGTILLSTEGINCFLAGTREHIDRFKAFLAARPAFSDMTYKESESDYQPFSRMLVRLKKEIISMGHPEIEPEKKKAPTISPEKFKQWYEDNKDMVVLDTRNDYEIALGTFESAVDLDIENFRQFPDTVKLLSDEIKKKPVVTFCTGGIRCEKAAEYMLENGFEEVYQLDGGILNYFEKCGGEHYDGDCFVFDKRVAVDSDLNEADVEQCYGCRGVIAASQKEVPCPSCGGQEFG